MVCEPAATLLNVIELVVGLVSGTVPSSTNVNGAVPFVVTVILPLVTPEQVTGVDVALAIKPAPAVTVILLMVDWQPYASVMSTLYVLAARLLKVVVVPVRVIFPGVNTKVNGAVPGGICGVIKRLPLFTPAHDVGVAVYVAVNPVPVVTV
jgi:hypothetical protein